MAWHGWQNEPTWIAAEYLNPDQGMILQWAAHALGHDRVPPEISLGIKLGTYVEQNILGNLKKAGFKENSFEYNLVRAALNEAKFEDIAQTYLDKAKRMKS